MSSKGQINRDTADREHELCVFLGGDRLALSVSRTLRRSGLINSVEVLRDEWTRSPEPGFYLADIRGIGAQALGRIREKLEA